MTETVKGAVSAVFPNKAGYYNFFLNDVCYGTGEKSAPEFEKGQVIEFSVETNGNFKNVEKGTLKVFKDAPPKAVRKGNTNKAASQNTNDYDMRQQQIAWQASRNTAIDFVKLLMDSEAFVLPKTKKNKVEVMEELVNHYQELFFQSTQELSNTVSTAVEVEDLSGEED